MLPGSNIFTLLFIAAMLPGAALATSAFNAPAGWASKAEVDLHVLERTYPLGRMTVHLSPWQGAGGDDVQTWLGSRKTTPSDFDPVVSTENAVLRGNENIENAYYVMRDLRPRRGAQRKSLLFACGKEGQIRTIDAFGPVSLFSGNNPDILADLAKVVKAACAEEIIFERVITRPELVATTPPQELEGVWYLADFVVGINGYEARQESVVVFADNTVTDDTRTVFSQGVQASKRQNPNSWGEWRIVDGSLEIKWNGSSDYTDYYVTIKARAGGENERIDGCYSSSFGYTLGAGGAAFGGGSTSIAINTWCFSENGRFSNDGTVAISGGTGPSVTGETIYSGSSSSEKTGWYRIDGNIIQLVYDNGTRVITSFGLRDDDTALLLNGGYYD